MTVQNRSYLLISGIISFFILFVTFFASVYLLFNAQKIKTYALKKDKYISISINAVAQTERKKVKPVVKKKVVKKEVHKKVKQVIDTPIVNEDIGSLFSNVATKKIVHKKREVKRQSIDNRVFEVVKKDFHTLKENQVDESLSRRLEELKLRNSKVALVNQKASTALDINEFLAKLQAFVYDRFYPPANSSGSSAIVRIWIGSDSKMSRFIIVAPSNNDYFDDEIKSLKRRLQSIKFPDNPEKKEIVIDITLIAKE